MATMPVQYHLGQFPPKTIEWSRLIPLIGPASAGLARYDALLSVIPNPHVLLSPLTIQEAVLSSKIEGTHVTISEVLEIEAGGKSAALTQSKREDAEEVLNYRKAMKVCVGELENHPLSQHMLRAAHSLLVQGVRGRDMTPGSYRTEQNWIGPEDCKIEEANYIPVAPEHLQYGMDEWERYLINNSEQDVLVQLAVLHVEFEALHPFKDGNGRLGRILIPLFLYQRKLLNSPDFYMSSYLEANREQYQEHLRDVSRDGDWTGWCVFFLNGISLQAAENELKARAILALYERTKTRVINLTHSQFAIRVVDFIFQSPVFPASVFSNQPDIPKATAKRILTILRDEGLLITLSEGKGQRSGIYAFRELLNITEGRALF